MSLDESSNEKREKRSEDPGGSEFESEKILQADGGRDAEDGDVGAGVGTSREQSADGAEVAVNPLPSEDVAVTDRASEGLDIDEKKAAPGGVANISSVNDGSGSASVIPTIQATGSIPGNESVHEMGNGSSVHDARGIESHASNSDNNEMGVASDREGAVSSKDAGTDSSRLAASTSGESGGIERVPLVKGQFANFTPRHLSLDDISEMRSQIGMSRNGDGKKASSDTMTKTWDDIISHVNANKPVFFLAPEAGLPNSFYSRNPGAVRSLVYHGKGTIDVTSLKKGQFHFGFVRSERALETLSEAGFMLVGCSGSHRYYWNNLRGNKQLMEIAMSDHNRLTTLYKTGYIRGFIQKPSNALSRLLASDKSHG
jgi:hypothetical protein